MSGETDRRRVFPDVGPIASVLTQHDVVTVRVPAVLEYENQFMAGAGKRAVAPVFLYPDANIKKIFITLLARRDEFARVSPVHAHEMDRSAGAVSRQKSQT